MDERNHCVPILDYIEDERIPHEGFLVMPALRIFDDPDFVSVDEAVEFIRQSLEVRCYLCNTSPILTWRSGSRLPSREQRRAQVSRSA